MNRLGHKFYGAVTLGERGQIVIPLEARDEMGLKSGEKLLVFGQGPKGTGLFVMRAEDVSGFVSEAMEKLVRLRQTVLAADNAGSEETPELKEGGSSGEDGNCR